MKHVFFVHSSITYLMAKQVIKEEKLAVESCIFLIDRISIFEKEQIKQVSFPFETFPNDFFKVEVNPIKGIKKAKVLARFVSKLVNNYHFIFYAPKAQANYFYLIIGHSLNLGFYYIEEGSGVYSYKNWQNPKKQIWLRQFLYDLNFASKVPSVKHFYDLKHPKYLGCFALHETAFKGFLNKRILNLPFEIKAELSGYQTIIVFSCEIEFGLMKSETYQFAVHKLMDYLIENKIEQAHYKFHPGQKNEISIAILLDIFKIYQTQIKLIEIESSIVLEEIAVSSPEVAYYICTSSIGLYATLANKKVYSYISYVRELEPDYQLNFEIPEFYSQKLIVL